ncbi:hypothetical protein HMPREF9098_1811 [Kingella denitrificans ATCC 33394]|uniref:JAB domain-containing protein n=1 Tax=Kingella denitrificans ATCC 33394 TaxID=888741 RepID=F0F126_9NEIS|nr:hypothetical protein HMPREF9098_1811 [Kingella denitrificans ATCC 33394]
MKKLNKQSNHQWHYLGEWHTHPEINPKPSKTDLEGWSELPKNSYYDRNIHLFWICSSEAHCNDWLSIRINNVFLKLMLKKR